MEAFAFACGLSEKKMAQRTEGCGVGMAGEEATERAPERETGEHVGAPCSGVDSLMSFFQSDTKP